MLAFLRDSGQVRAPRGDIHVEPQTQLGTQEQQLGNAGGYPSRRGQAKAKVNDARALPGMRPSMCVP